jgi:hypothetical protein
MVWVGLEIPSCMPRARDGSAAAAQVEQGKSKEQSKGKMRPSAWAR